MLFKPQQILRTKIPLKAADHQISPGTRVVVLGMDEDGRVRVKVQDAKLGEALQLVRLTASVGAFNLTHRGRPKNQ